MKVGNKLSNEKCQKNGVPQGSVLSPTLFLLMINDVLPNQPPGIKISLFADDIAIWISSEFIKTCFIRLQLALKIIQTWSAKWGLRFSPEKTKAMIFMKHQLKSSNRYKGHGLSLEIYNKKIEIVSNHRYLGIIFDSYMTGNALVFP